MRFYESTEKATCYLNTDRFGRQAKEAQKVLNTMVVADSTPFVPFRSGNLRSNVQYPNGIYGDVIEWATPYAHYQYTGILYLAGNGSSYAHAGEVKYPTDRSLAYHNGGGSEWFARAKAQNGSKWIQKTKKIAGGG